MKRTDFNIVLGVLLVGAGTLFLLQTLNVVSLDTTWETLWAIMFGVGGLAFAWRFISDRTESWWAAIPGFALLALSVLIALHLLGMGDGREEGTWLGALFLGAIGLSFLAVYLVRREHWWAIIPAGVLLTLTVLTLASTWLENEAMGGLFFFGLALTFGLVALLPTSHGRMTWALIPASVLALLGGAAFLPFNSAFNYVWALGLILAGLYLLYRRLGGGEIIKRG